MLFDANGSQYMHTPAVLAIAVVATIATIVAALRNRHMMPRRSWGWLAVPGLLVLSFLYVLEGRYFDGFVLEPLQGGGVAVALEYVWVAGVLISLAWAWLDPRLSWAAALLSAPFLVPRQATFARNEMARSSSSSVWRFRQAM